MRTHRSLLLVVLVLAVVGAACNTGKKVATTAGPTEAASASPSVQSSGDFQLVGRAQHAFVGVGPGIDVSQAQSSAATASPEATATSSATFGASSQGGVMRVLLDDAN